MIQKPCSFSVLCRSIADWLQAPDTMYLLDFVKPEFLLLRVRFSFLAFFSLFTDTKNASYFNVFNFLIQPTCLSCRTLYINSDSVTCQPKLLLTTTSPCSKTAHLSYCASEMEFNEKYLKDTFYAQC